MAVISTLNRFVSMYDEVKKRTGFEPKVDYNEPFDSFCRNLVATELLTKEERELIRGLLDSWESNKRRK